MNHRLIDGLFDAGLLQFGRFETARGPALFQHHLDWLPSYPDLLQDLIAAIVPLVPDGCERLLCPLDGLATTTGVSLQTGLPVVYRAGRHASLTHDFIGAYDVGHPTTLIVHDLSDAGWLKSFAEDARRVGLMVDTLIPVIEINRPATQLRYRPVLSLSDLLDYLVLSGKLSAEQARAVLSLD